MAVVLNGVVVSGAILNKYPGDENWPNTVLLLPGNGTNGSQNNTFLDASTNNFTITRNGNTTQGTFTPYGDNWSNYFNGSSYITAPANAAWVFTGDVTFECWIYIAGDSALDGNSQRAVALFRNAVTGTVNFQFMLGGSNTTTGTGLSIYRSNDLNYNVNFSFAKFTWYHVAAVRASNVWTFYVNGTAIGTPFTFAGTIGSSLRTMEVGGSAYTSFSNILNGYISNARMVNGTALYTTNFTPPAQPLTAITNTSLLTCQSNRFRDNSTNNFTITTVGTPSIQKFTPFLPSNSYSATAIGGSGYFDGTGDYLSLVNNAAFNLNADFTIECWVYPAALPATVYFIGQASSTDYAPILLSLVSGKPGLAVSSNGTSWTINATTTGAISLNTWTHLAWVRSGNKWSIYINGVENIIAASTAVTPYTSTDPLGIGSEAVAPINYPYTGYISNLRIVKGTAVYTANFTPPTAPLSAITNTQLLLLHTNASIIDNAMMNNVETVGNAQISTTQSKWGGSSIRFDGAGDALSCTGISLSGNYNQLTASGKVNTIEFWLYVSAFVSPRSFLVGSWVANAGPVYNGWTYDIDTSGNIFISNDGTGNTVTLSTKVTTGTWQHLAFINNGTNLIIYLNGNNVGSRAVQAPTSYVGPLFIGQRSDSSLPLNGYINDLRITNGIVRYTANFTPPTTALSVY